MADRSIGVETAADLITQAIPHLPERDHPLLRAIAAAARIRTATTLLDSQPYNLTRFLLEVLQEEPLPGMGAVHVTLEQHRAVLGKISVDVLQVVKAMHDAKMPERLDLSGLLRALSSYGAGFKQLYPLIKQKVQLVSLLTEGRWVVPAVGPGNWQRLSPNIDPIETVRLVEQMARTGKPVSFVAKRDTDLKLIPLGAAMGWNTRPVRHPFTGEAVFGLDDNSVDISCFDPDRLDAAAYARRQEPHPASPYQLDLTSFMQDFAKPRTLYWREMLEKYREEVELKIQPPNLRYADVRPYTWFNS